MAAIDIKTENNIVKLTINRPNALNAINKEVMEALNHFFLHDYINQGVIYGVILSGAGEKAFAAGADIKEFESLSQDETTRLSRYGHDTYFAIENFHVPVIALVNGFALGGGCELAMACHFRIATPNAKFGQPEVNLGLLPGYGGSQRLVQLIGKSKALEYLLTTDMISADEALNLGLTNHVLPVEEAWEKAETMLNKIGSKGPMAVTETIKAVNEGLKNQGLGYQYEAKAFGRVMVSEEAKEGVSAFVEKRKANFRKD